MKRPAMAATGLECPYEASDEASESELLDRSLSVWRGRQSLDGTEEFAPIPLDLHTACSIGQYDCVRNIIQRGDLDLNTKNRGGWTALMYACYIGHDNVVNLLLDARVHVNVKNNKGQTPLMLAASCGNESVAYFLLQQGAELEARDKKGWTALFHATYSGHQNLVKFLLENNADMEAKEPVESFTPFMVAAAEGHEIIVQYFLQHGVNVNAKGRNGDMARTLALMNGYTKIVSLIDNHSPDLPAGPRADPGLRLQADLSSSDEAVNRPRRHTNTKPTRRVSKGPSIRDGPEAFAKLVNIDVQVAQPVTNPSSCIPKGYVTFKSDNVAPPETGHIRSRDVTSPIDPEDHTGSLDSSVCRDFNEYDDDTNAFSKTGALTIKSSSSSSGGLVAAFGISRSGSADEEGSSSSAVQSDPGQRPKVKQVKDPGQGHTSPELKVKKKSCGQTAKVKNVPVERKEPRPPPVVTAPPHRTETPTARVPPFPPFPADIISAPRPTGPPTDPRLGKISQPSSLLGPTGVGVAGDKGWSVPRSEPASGGTGMNAYSRPHDLPSLLKELGLTKYLVIFAEQDVDLQVFLSLTDNDLKEIGIKLFGPRRKMTNAIARWHSNAPSSGQSLEQAYADKLEAEMQEMAIQLHQAYEQVEQFKAQVLQERELRSVTEGCLMEDRSSWQHVHRLAADTLQRCTETQEDVARARRYAEELSRHRFVEDANTNRPEDSLVKALHQGLSLAGDPGKITSGNIQDGDDGDLCQLPAASLLQRLNVAHDDIRRSVTIVALNVEKLLGRNASYGGMREGFS